jgi:hypothetical protein
MTHDLRDMNKHTLPENELLALSLIAQIVPAQTPDGTKVALHTKLFVQQGEPEFMACVINEASDIAAERGAHISAVDICSALGNLGARSEMQMALRNTWALLLTKFLKRREISG